MKHLLSLLLLLFTFLGFSVKTQNSGKNGKFSFAFLTDIHLNKGNNGCFDGIKNALEHTRAEKVDFILTGGDNVDIDVLGKDSETAHELYQNYAKIISNSGLKYYATLGNHDRFLGCNKDDSLYNEGLFEKYINKSYYSFEHKGWHFIVLNTTQTCEGKYCVGEVQKKWLEDDLKKVDVNTPIVISVHVPFLSVYYPALEGRYTETDTFSNFKEIWDLFEDKNLKLVLQGHMHLYEEIMVKGVQFITAGAVSGSWWSGSYHGTEEGFLKVSVSGEDFTWEYVDYGWKIKNK